MAGTTWAVAAQMTSRDTALLVDLALPTHVQPGSVPTLQYVYLSTIPVNAPVALGAGTVQYAPLLLGVNGVEEQGGAFESFRAQPSMALQFGWGETNRTIVTGRNTLGSIFAACDPYSGSVTVTVREWQPTLDATKYATVFVGQIESIERVTRDGMDWVLTDKQQYNAQSFDRCGPLPRYLTSVSGTNYGTLLVDQPVQDRVWPRCLGSFFPHDGTGNPLATFGLAATAYTWMNTTRVPVKGVGNYQTFGTRVHVALTAAPALTYSGGGGKVFSRYQSLAAGPYTANGLYTADDVWLWQNSAWAHVTDSSVTLQSGQDGAGSLGQYFQDVIFTQDSGFVCEADIPLGGLSQVIDRTGTYTAAAGTVQMTRWAPVLQRELNGYGAATGTFTRLYFYPQRSLEQVGTLLNWGWRFEVTYSQGGGGVGTLSPRLGTLTGLVGESVNWLLAPGARTLYTELVHPGWYSSRANTPDNGTLYSNVQQWDFQFNSGTDYGTPYLPDLTIELRQPAAAGGTFQVHYAGLYVRYQYQPSRDTLTLPYQIVQSGVGLNQHMIDLAKGRDTVRPQYTQVAPRTLTDISALPPVFVTTGANDSFNTGTVYDHPATILQRLLVDAAGATDMTLPSSGFGCLADAKTDLQSAYASGTAFLGGFTGPDGPTRVYDAVAGYARQFLMAVTRQRDGAVRVFSYNPVNPTASRFWRNTAGTYLTAAMVTDFSYDWQPARSTAHRIVVRHRSHPATGNMDGLVTVDETDDGGYANPFRVKGAVSDSTTYLTAKQRCAQAKLWYDAPEPFEWAAPDVPRGADAATLRDRLAARVCYPALTVQFDTPEDIADLFPYHLLQFGDDFQEPYPLISASGNRWANRYFEVTRVQMRRYKPSLWRVEAREYAPQG